MIGSLYIAKTVVEYCNTHNIFNWHNPKVDAEDVAARENISGGIDAESVAGPAEVNDLGGGETIDTSSLVSLVEKSDDTDGGIDDILSMLGTLEV